MLWTLEAYRIKYGEWPTRLLVERDTWPSVEHYLTPEQLSSLRAHLEIILDAPEVPYDSFFVAEGPAGSLGYRGPTLESDRERVSFSEWLGDPWRRY